MGVGLPLRAMEGSKIYVGSCAASYFPLSYIFRMIWLLPLLPLPSTEGRKHSSGPGEEVYSVGFQHSPTSKAMLDLPLGTSPRGFGFYLFLSVASGGLAPFSSFLT